MGRTAALPAPGRPSFAEAYANPALVGTERRGPERSQPVDEDHLPEDGGRPFAELRSSGLLWLINRTVFHPRGLALALVEDGDGNDVGWDLLGDGAEPISFPPDLDAERFAAVAVTLAEHLQGR